MERAASKPTKKTDKELDELIREKLAVGDYIFLQHAKQRLNDRNVLDTDVLYILENRKGYGRARNKRKDKYEAEHKDWSYCFEGCNCDDKSIRIIISFDSNLLLIITMIVLNR